MLQTTLSGPELGVEVARRVMGWDKAGIVNGRCYIPCGQGFWAPHESISDAWEVVEKLLGLGYTLELYSPGALINDEFGTHSVGWGAEFCTWGEPYLRSGRVGKAVCHTMDEKSGGAAIETTHEAICLAALKALE